MLTLTTFLTSCSTAPQVVTYKSKPIDKPDLILPETSVLELREVDFVIVTEDNIASIIQDMKDDGKNVALFALTDEGYENISLNNGDLLKLLSEQKAIIAAYEAYYKNINKEVDAHNEKGTIEIEVPEEPLFNFLN